MTKSDTIDQLSLALSKAQAEMPVVAFDSVNPHFKAKYASLASIARVINPILAKHELSITQIAESTEEGYSLVTTLMHKSGQFIQGRMALLIDKNNMQGLGSAITYARRYGYSMVGVVTDEDDDANKASETTAAKPPPRFTPPSQPQDQEPDLDKALGTGPKTAPQHRNNHLTEPQIKRLFALARKAQWSNEDVKNYMKNNFNLTSTDNMRRDQYELICSVLDAGTDVLNAMSGPSIF